MALTDLCISFLLKPLKTKPTFSRLHGITRKVNSRLLLEILHELGKFRNLTDIIIYTLLTFSQEKGVKNVIIDGRGVYLMRFFEVIRGALMAAPIKLLPVI